MNIPAKVTKPTLETLYALFTSADDLPEYEYVPASEVPQPYHELLVHKHHMTVTVEHHHGDLVNVRVLECVRQRNSYARKILLELQGSGRVVQFGIMRVHFHYCSDEVRREILSERTPLGRILIRHNVLRRIEPTAYVRVTPSPAIMRWFDLSEPVPLYGRLAFTYCNGQPAVELLEVVAPE
jgi:chorismate-pyruvate lyase